MQDFELLAEFITNEIMKALHTIVKDETVEVPEVKAAAGNVVQKDKKRRVICTEDLRNLGTGDIELSKGDIITPLAKDCLRDMKINVVYRWLK